MFKIASTSHPTPFSQSGCAVSKMFICIGLYGSLICAQPANPTQFHAGANVVGEKGHPAMSKTIGSVLEQCEQHAYSLYLKAMFVSPDPKQFHRESSSNGASFSDGLKTERGRSARGSPSGQH